MFLKGNLVTMSDGSKKKIEDLVPGDLVRDGYGMNVFVRGAVNLYNAYSVSSTAKRPIKVNNEIVCLRDQVFMGADGNFYVMDGVDNDMFYVQPFWYFVGYNNTTVIGPNFDIKNKTRALEIGSIIMKESGPVEVNSIELLDPVTVEVNASSVWDNFYSINNENTNVSLDQFMPIGPSIYKHKIGARGTYIVDDYVCLATQNKFWDYDDNVYMKDDEYLVYRLKNEINQRLIASKDTEGLMQRILAGRGLTSPAELNRE